MLELLLALAAAPVTQDTVASAAAITAQSGPLTVSQGGIMIWPSGGQVTVIVDNSGSETDRVLSVRTPSGTVGAIGVYPVTNGRGERAPGGDLSIGPGRTGVLADLTSVAPDQPAQPTVTVVFERGGEVTVLAVPTTPVAAPPPAN